MNFNTTTNRWIIMIPGQPGDVIVEFHLQAFGEAGNNGTSFAYDYTVKTLIPEDINGDGKVDVLDLYILSKKFSQSSP